MKKALALLLALVMALALVACGGGNNAGKTNDQGGSATPPPQTDEPDKNDEPAPIVSPTNIVARETVSRIATTAIVRPEDWMRLPICPRKNSVSSRYFRCGFRFASWYSSMGIFRCSS